MCVVLQAEVGRGEGTEQHALEGVKRLLLRCHRFQGHFPGNLRAASVQPVGQRPPLLASTSLCFVLGQFSTATSRSEIGTPPFASSWCYIRPDPIGNPRLRVLPTL